MVKVGLKLAACIAAFATRLEANEVTECATSADDGDAQNGHVLLQAKAVRGTEHSEKQRECPLPAGAKWCQVRLDNTNPYFMAVYDTDDWVSHNICEKGYWEEHNMADFGPPGNMLDIGGNIGYHTFAFAAAGWNVTAFEPMAPNHALINASLCINPYLAAKIHVNYHGLGTSSELCRMVAPGNNKGDGFVKCGDVAIKGLNEAGFVEIGTFSIHRLDTILLQQNIATVDLIKIDVEGYEGQVFNGAPDFFSQYHPRLIKTEVWPEMANSTGSDYLGKFAKAGYTFFRDNKCQVPYPEVLTNLASIGGTDVVACKL